MAEHAGKKARVRSVPIDRGDVAKIGPRLVSTAAYKPLFQVEGAPDFSPHFERLLTFAKVEETLDSRGALDNALKMAWVFSQLESDSRDYPPAKLVKSLDKAIRKTKALLRKVEKHLRTPRIAFDLCPIGEGTFSVKTVREMIPGEPVGVPRQPPPLASRRDKVDRDGSVAAINIYRVLERLQREISKHKRRRTRPPEKGKAAIVAHAAGFFREHSASKITSYSSRKTEGPPGGDFVPFCQAFYKTVTGKSDALETYIRAEVKRSTFGS